MDDEWKVLTVGAQGDVLQAFSKALQREMHNLTTNPDLLWQQLYNRLQWEGQEISSLLQLEKESRKVANNRPWFRTLTVYQESESYIRSLVGHTGRLSRIRFTPDGKKIISTGDDGLICLWDSYDGNQQTIFRGHQGRVSDFDFLNQSDCFVSAGRDGTLRVWSISRQKSMGVLIRQEEGLFACGAIPKANLILAGDKKGVLHSLSLSGLGKDDFRVSNHSTINFGAPIVSMSVSPNGMMIGCGHYDGSVSLWDLRSGSPKLLSLLGKHEDVVFSSCFSPNGLYFITGDGIGILRCWDCQDQILKYETVAHEGAIMDCHFSPSGDRLISVGDDSRIRIEKFESSKSSQSVRIIQGHYRPVTCLDISPSEEFLVSGSDDGTIRVWNYLSNLNLDQNKNDGHARWAVATSISEDGKRLISGSRDGDIILWDMQTKKIIKTFGPQPKLEWCDLSPDGNTIISCGDGARVWDVETGCQTASILLESPVFWCGFSPDGDVVIIINIKGKHFWDLTEPDPIFIKRIHGATRNPAKKQKVPGPDLDFSSIRCDFSPYGSRIVTPGSEGRIGIWEVDGERPFILGKHEDTVVSCVWNPDGSIIASGGKDGLIKLWNIDNRSLKTTIDAHQGWINQLEFFGSELLFSISSDGNAYLWDIKTENPVCIYPVKGDVLLSCATHFESKLVSITDIAGKVHILEVEFD